MSTAPTAPTAPQAALAALALTIEAKFVPFSHSRNAKENSPSLNWRVTVLRNGRPVLETDYSAGRGNCDAYKAPREELGMRGSLMRDKALRAECEEGRSYKTRKPYTLKAEDVLYCLVMDAGVLDEGGFEQWAGSLGYDTDSRKAEAIYRACLETALKLRAALGEDGLRQLREAFQDY